MAIIPYLYYPMLLAAAAFVSIAFSREKAVKKHHVEA